MTVRPHSHIYYVFQSFALINYFRYRIGWYSRQHSNTLQSIFTTRTHLLLCSFLLLVFLLFFLHTLHILYSHLFIPFVSSFIVFNVVFDWLALLLIQ